MANLPLEFLKCLTLEEARARLAAGRPYSALIVDSALPGLDRDLVDLARRQGAAVLVVADPRVSRDWVALGASAVLPTDLDRDDLLTALRGHALPIADVSLPRETEPAHSPSWRGALVAVTGGGGVGSSTLAIALAQGLAADPRYGTTVLLADLALRADQAMLHDSRARVPGLPELVEAHRSGTPRPEEVRSLSFEVTERGYRLLLGLRRHREWAALRPRAVEVAIESLVRGHRAVVADVECDVEGEAECGSFDVEERNVLSRCGILGADLALVVGLPGLVGIHRLSQLIGELLAAGMDPGRILPVLNRAPRHPRARSELAAAVARLRDDSHAPDRDLPSPIFVPERRGLELALHDGLRLPDSLCTPLARSVAAILQHRPRVVRARDPEPVPVVPGSLGSWSTDAEVG